MKRLHQLNAKNNKKTGFSLKFQLVFNDDDVEFSMTLSSRLSPMTSCYIRKLYEKREMASMVISADTDVDISEISGFDVNYLLAKTYRDKDLYLGQLSQLENLTYLHQELDKSKIKPQEQLTRIEAKIFAILEPSHSQAPAPSALAVKHPQPAPQMTPKDLLQVLEHVLGVAARYLGPTLAVTYLLNARREEEWLQQFEVRSPTQIQYLGLAQEETTQSQRQSFKTWTDSFIRRCAQILPHFPQLVDARILTRL